MRYEAIEVWCWPTDCAKEAQIMKVVAVSMAAVEMAGRWIARQG